MPVAMEVPHIGLEPAPVDEARVLYLSHNGLTEPLGRRQVLPYLVGLSARGWRFTVVSFEKPWTASGAQLAAVEEELRTAGIYWQPLKYHHRPPVLSTAFDVAQGIRIGRRHRRDARLVHARSTVPALMARWIVHGAGIPWIFDVRGLIAEEYVDAGHWRLGGVRHRVTADLERRLLQQADGVVTLTQRIVERLPQPTVGGSARPAAVIPCSVDLETFRPSPEWRGAVRRELGLAGEPVLAYSGSLGSWYRLEEMLDFFEVASRTIAGLRFLWLTPQATSVTNAAGVRGLASRVIARSLEPDAVPRHLAAADVGICFLGKHESKRASSPTKFAEYLAAGLPVITNGWIGDASSLAGEESWILVDDFSDSAYKQGADRLGALLARPLATRTSARALAGREFALDAAVDRYDALYRQILAR